MHDFIIRNKGFLGICAITLLILFGGVALFSKDSSAQKNNVTEAILVSPDSQKTGTESFLKIVEFGDYQCPACAIYHPFIKQLLLDFPGKIDFVYRNFPLPSHKNAKISAYAAEAAGLQGKFWEMHNKLFEAQGAWSDLDNPKDVFIEYAVSLGLDKNKFLEDIDSQAVKNVIDRGLSDGRLAGISSTPTFFINGEEMALVGTYEELKRLVEDILNSQ